MGDEADWRPLKRKDPGESGEVGMSAVHQIVGIQRLPADISKLFL